MKDGENLVHICYADGSGALDTSKWTDWVCPTCGWFVGELYSGFGRWHIQQDVSYCAKCGQKIDWTLPEENIKRMYEEKMERERIAHEKECGVPLDNMNERRRKKYGMLSE